jgi:hypothetical protein
LVDGKELRKQVRELRRRSFALRERYQGLVSAYNELQKQWKELTRLSAEHRLAVAQKLRTIRSASSTYDSPAQAAEHGLERNSKSTAA